MNLAGRYELAESIGSGAAAALQHSGIVHVYDVGETDEGGAYRAVLDRWGGAKPRSTTAEAARARARTLRCKP